MTLTKRPFLAHRLSTWESELLDEIAAQEHAESPQAVAGIPLVEKTPTVSGSIGISTHIRGSGTPVPAPQKLVPRTVAEMHRDMTAYDKQCESWHPTQDARCHFRQDGHTQHFNPDIGMWSDVNGVPTLLKPQVSKATFEATFTREEWKNLTAGRPNLADNSLGARVQRFLTDKVAPDAKCVAQIPQVEIPKQRMQSTWKDILQQAERDVALRNANIQREWPTQTTPKETDLRGISPVWDELQCRSRHPYHDDRCQRLASVAHCEHHNISTGRKW